MDNSRMHPASAKLALELQLSRINDILREINRSRISEAHRGGFGTMKDMEGRLRLLETQILTHNILRADYDSRVTIYKLLEEEKQAVDDRRYAMSFQGLQAEDLITKDYADYEAGFLENQSYKSDGEGARTMEIYSADFCLGAVGPASVDDADNKDDANTGSSEDGSEGSKHEPNPIITCCACMEMVPIKDSVELVCDHTYCRACLTNHFKAALVDTDSFPPRCCKISIPVEICHAVLPQGMIKQIDLKIEELAHVNPTYCCNAECATFLQSKNIKNDVGTCVFCGNTTCIQCKGEEHAGLCPKDPDVVLLMEVAKQSRWQQCSRCKNMVELSHGCFHMTCRCSHQFCYLCGVQWKKCGCPQWIDTYLTLPPPLQDAVQPAAQGVGPAPAAGPALQNIDQAVAQGGCAHNSRTRNTTGGINYWLRQLETATLKYLEVVIENLGDGH